MSSDVLAFAVLMIRPACFGFNAEAAETNAMAGRLDAPDVAARARAEADAFARALDRAGVRVLVVEDTPTPPKPDALFPNNWVSFHRDGTVALYPMCPATRRAERRRDVIDQVAAAGFRVARVLDWSAEEARGRFLEGTGSMVLDRARRIAFACPSPRTDPALLAEVGAALGYTPHLFRAEIGGVAPYHTNVLLSVGAGVAVLCPDAVHPADLPGLRAALDGRDLVEIDLGQQADFAGNVLQVGGPVIAMSTRALDALRPHQVHALERHGQIVAAPLDVIERVGGGSARCMLAEVFLPPTS